MPEQYYKDAQKLAQKEFRACISKGEHPYLPRLDDFLPPERLSGGTDLGICQIPTELIVGTRSSARANAFARNFMPLLDEPSEFSIKWTALCQSHLEEGIREPVKVYEYLNRFYVEEGNKRVSVLKFFDAPLIAARVIRVLPEKNDTREVALYYEFLEYYRCARLNFPEFSKPGCYAVLLRLLGKSPENVWSGEERNAFSTAYHYFRQAYESCGGNRLASTVGDALLAYLRVYGYASLRERSAAAIKKNVSAMWEEMTLQQEQTPIDVKLAPGAEKPGGLLSKVLKSEPKPLRVAFLHDRSPELSGWVNAHELGRRHIERVFQGEIETSVYDNAMDGDAFAALERAIADGNTVLFTTSPRLLPASLRAAVEHPKVTILNCSLNQSHRYIRTYYARMYEVKFILGAVAGALAKGQPVGYVCDYPIFGQVAGVNAFALGVQMVSPDTRVFLEWSSVGGLDAAVQRLADGGIRWISSLDTVEKRDRFGLYRLTDSGAVRFARPVWNWGVYYEAILRRIRDRSFYAEYTESSRALNYFWGLSAGVVALECTSAMPACVRRLAALLHDGICGGNCDPFRGPLYAQDGRQIAEEGRSLDPEQIIRMSWLAENVVGAIPAYEELNDMGKATVGIVGVKQEE